MRIGKRYSARIGEILSRDGNRLLLIEGQAILLLLFSACFTLSYTFSFLMTALIDEVWVRVTVDRVCGLLISAFVIFAALPLFYGLFFMARKMTLGESCTLADMFVAFGDRKAYARAVWGMRFLFVIGVLVFTAASILAAVISATGGTALWNAALPMISLLITLLLNAPFYTCIYESLSEVKHLPTFADSFRRAIRFFVAFLPWILLGLLTVGVLLIADTVPRMLLAYVSDASDACGADTDIPKEGIASSFCDK